MTVAPNVVAGKRVKTDREVAIDVPSDAIDPGKASQNNITPAADVTQPPKTGPPNGASRILRWPEVHNLIGRSRTQIWRDIRAGKFPAPLVLGKNAVGWYEHEVVAWMESRPRAAYAA